MQESLVKKIRQNLYSLVDVTSDLQELVKIFKEKGVFNEEDVEEIDKIDISFDKKTTFYWTIVKKDDEAFDLLLETFKSQGNDEGVKILTAEAPSEGPAVTTVEADVTVESTNEEGRHIAENMEKEFDQIQSEDNEMMLRQEGNKSEIQVTEEFLKKNETRELEISPEDSEEIRDYAEDLTRDIVQEAERINVAQLDEVEVESPVKVEVTPPESPEPEREEQVEEITAKPEEVETQSEESQVEVIPEPIKPKQVSFGTPKEFTISKDEFDSSKSNGEEEGKSSKSIVAQNREIFEKSAPKGVKVKYSFKKEDATNSVETPENKVSSLKNFFQNLSSGSKGSKDDSNAGVERRGGNKLGGVHPNRRTVAS